MKSTYIDTVELNIDNETLKVVLDKTFFVDMQSDAKLLPAGKEVFHFHLYHEFFFVSNDELKIVTEQGEYRFKNAVVIVPPNFKHYSVRGDNTYRLFVNFDENKRGPACLGTFFNLLSRNELHHVPKNEELIFYLHKLQTEIEKPTDNGRLKIETLLTMLFLTVADLLNLSLKNRTKKAVSNQNEYIFKIESSLQDSVMENVNLSYLANRLFLSEKQVSRIIKKNFNCTLSELVNDYKLSAAELLLKNTEKSVADIIEELNFQTESYFFVLFKKKYGCTPLAYRKHARLS